MISPEYMEQRDAGRSEPIIVALTGPPAAGKSTVMGFLEDIGVPCISTGDVVREMAEDRFDDPDEDDVWQVATDLRDEYGPAGPTMACGDWIEENAHDSDVLCVADLRDDAEVEWLRSHIGPTLVVRVDAESYTRSNRYVQREIGDEDLDVVSHDRVRGLRRELYDREQREHPYPDHDVSIMNEDDVSLNDICRRLENLVTVIEA